MIESNFLLAKTTEHFELLQSQRRYNADLTEEQALNESALYAISKKAYKALVFDLEKAKFDENQEKIQELEEQVKTYKALLEKLKKALVEQEFKPACPLCNDVGSKDGKPCSCYFKKLNELSYEFLEVKPKRLASFKDDKLSFVVNTEKFMNSFKDYASNFSLNSKSILLSGQRGTGKTFIAQCVATQLNENCFNAIYLTMFDFNDIFVKQLYSSNQEKLITKEILTTCDLLILDDLGSEQILNKITIENLLLVISERINNKKPYLITTNLSFEEIELRYGERLSSRLLTAIHPVLNGVDLRKLIKQ